MDFKEWKQTNSKEINNFSVGSTAHTKKSDKCKNI